jgi:hypothetical protein
MRPRGFARWRAAAYTVISEIYYSSLVPRTYLCARLFETLD